LDMLVTVRREILYRNRIVSCVDYHHSPLNLEVPRDFHPGKTIYSVNY